MSGLRASAPRVSDSARRRGSQDLADVLLCPLSVLVEEGRAVSDRGVWDEVTGVTINPVSTRDALKVAEAFYGALAATATSPTELLRPRSWDQLPSPHRERLMCLAGIFLTDLKMTEYDAVREWNKLFSARETVKVDIHLYPELSLTYAVMSDSQRTVVTSLRRFVQVSHGL